MKALQSSNCIVYIRELCSDGIAVFLIFKCHFDVELLAVWLPSADVSLSYASVMSGGRLAPYQRVSLTRSYFERCSKPITSGA